MGTTPVSSEQETEATIHRASRWLGHNLENLPFCLKPKIQAAAAASGGVGDFLFLVHLGVIITN